MEVTLLSDTGHQQKGAYLSEWLLKPLHHVPDLKSY